MNNVNNGQNFRPRRNNYKKGGGGGRQDFRRGGGNNHGFNTGQGGNSHQARHPELDIVVDARAVKRANMMRDKYQSMARDAQTGGDRVYAEFCLQHVEHYNRILNAYNESRPQQPRPDGAEDASGDMLNGNGSVNGNGLSAEADGNDAASVAAMPSRNSGEEESFQTASN